MAKSTSHINGYSDDDVIFSVSGKDADQGFRYIMPAPKLPENISPSHRVAVSAGLHRLAISGAQNAATKAREGKYVVEHDGKKVSLGEQEAVQHYLDNLDVSQRSVETVSAKRMEIALEMCGKACAARGIPASEYEVNLAPWLAGPKGTGANRESVEVALRDFLNAPYVVNKRGKGGTAASESAPQDW